MAEPYTIHYAAEARHDAKNLRPFDKAKVLDGIKAHLSHEPTKVSRSRIKRMEQPFWSQYRLRAEDLRVDHAVDQGSRTVIILRILEKGTAETPKEADNEAS